MPRNRSWATRVYCGVAPRAAGMPIYDVKQALDNPWVTNSDRIMETPVAGGRPLRTLSSPIRYAGRPHNAAAPALGEHSAEVLAAAGVSAAEIARLRALGVV